MDDLSWYESLDADSFKCFICMKEYRGNLSKARKHGKSERHRKIFEIRSFESDKKEENLLENSREPELKNPTKKTMIFKKAINKNGVTNLLKRFHKNEANCDVVLKAKNGQIRAHKIVLISACKFFKEILKSSIHFDIQEETLVLMLDFNLEVLRILVEFFYTGEVFIPKKWLTEFKSVCKVLNLKPLIEHLTNFCKSTDKQEQQVKKPEPTPEIQTIESQEIRDSKKEFEKLLANYQESIEKEMVPEVDPGPDNIIDDLSNFLNFEGKLPVDLEMKMKKGPVIPDTPKIIIIPEKSPPKIKLNQLPTQKPTDPKINRNKRRNPSELSLFPPLPMEDPFSPSPTKRKPEKLIKCMLPRRTVVPKIFQNSPHIRAFFEVNRT